MEVKYLQTFPKALESYMCVHDVMYSTMWKQTRKWEHLLWLMSWARGFH